MYVIPWGNHIESVHYTIFEHIDGWGGDLKRPHLWIEHLEKCSLRKM